MMDFVANAIQTASVWEAWIIGTFAVIGAASVGRSVGAVIANGVTSVRDTRRDARRWRAQRIAGR